MGLIYGDVSWGGGGMPHWIGEMESICRGVPWGRTSLAGSGRWDWFMGTCGTLAGSGRWNCFMRTRDTGWSGAMGLIYGCVWHWLEWVDGSDSRVLTIGAHDTGWIRVMGLIYGGVSMGHATRAGSGWWDWFMGYVMGAHDWIREMGLICGDTPLGVTLAGTRHGGARLDQGDGIDLWGRAMGVRHWLDVGDEIDLWGRSMGARNWIGAMELICGAEPWKRTTLARSGWGDWFMWARHEGARHWLDWGYGIDSWGMSNDKMLYGCWIWMTIPCVLCLALR